MGVIYTSTAAGQVQNSTVEGTLVPAGGGTLVIGGGALQVGNFIRLSMMGNISTDAVAPTLRLRVKLAGGSTVVIGDTTARTAGALMSGVWELVFLFGWRTLGAPGTLAAHGYAVLFQSGIVAVQWHFGGTAVFNVDTTVDQTIDVTAQWGTANANNIISSNIFIVEESGA